MAEANRSEPVLSSGLRTGARFVVRHRLPPDGPHTMTDVVGDVVSLTDDTVVLRTQRHGEVTVPLALVTTVKEVPPTPGRRGRPHRAISIEDLERVAVDGWTSSDRTLLGDWVLRAAGGYTGRANSALVVGHPDRPLPEALRSVQEWYVQRDLPPLLQLPLSPGSTADDDPLAQEAARLGWEWFQPVEVMTAPTRDVLTIARGVTPDEELHETTDLTDLWWGLADERMRSAPQAARTVLTGSPEQVFSVLLVDGTPAARARTAFAHGWGGLYAVETQPAFRGRGLASALIGRAAQQAADRGVFSLYLQVAAANTQAVRLYERLGFSRHHQYVYLRPIDSTS